MILPTPRLAVVVVLIGAGVVLVPVAGLGVLLAADGLLLVVLVVDALRTRSPRSIEVEREVPQIVPLGETAVLTWRVRNPSAQRVRLRLADSLTPSLRPDRRRAAVVVPPRGSTTATTTLAPLRRGRFDFDEVVVRTFSPLGLLARQAARSLPGTVRVYPPMGFARRAAELLDRSRTAEAGLRLAAHRGGGSDFDSLREYTPDDEYRRIDWAATARALKPIVRTYRPERNQVVQLLVDVGRTSAGRVRDPELRVGPGAEVPRLDHALDAALLTAAVAHGMGDRVGMVAYGEAVQAVVPPSGRRDQVGRILAACYALEPQLASSDHHAALAASLARSSRRGMVVLLTDLSAAPVDATLMGALALVLRRHLVVIAAVTDPAVDAWARGPVTDTASAHRRAAAIDALDERAGVARRLRARGAIVVDAPPGELGTALARTYLDVKASGRL